MVYTSVVCLCEMWIFSYGHGVEEVVNSRTLIFTMFSDSYRTEEVVYEWERSGIEVSPDLTHDHYDIRVEALDTQNYSHHTSE